MADLIVDPTDENVAILNDGRVGHAMRVLPADSPPPTTMAEFNRAPIIGYGRFGIDEASDRG
jgi:hypothetical protein